MLLNPTVPKITWATLSLLRDLQGHTQWPISRVPSNFILANCVMPEIKLGLSAQKACAFGQAVNTVSVTFTGKAKGEEGILSRVGAQ